MAAAARLASLLEQLSLGSGASVVWSSSCSALQRSGAPELIPFGCDDDVRALLNSTWAADIIAWMKQKDELGQDMFM